MWRQWGAAVAMLFATGCGGSGCLYGVATERPREADAAPAASAQPSSEPSRPRIVALGDSLTAGLGLLESQAYPAVLQQRLDAVGYDFEVVNAGVSGDTSAGGVRRLEWALEGNVRILIVALGANDALRGLSIEEMRRNLSEIIERARGRGVAVLLAGMQAPPNYGPDYTVKFRQTYMDLARAHHVTFVPFLLAGVAGETRYNQSDGIHPNQEGARVVADTIWRALEPMVAAAAQ